MLTTSRPARSTAALESLAAELAERRRTERAVILEQTARGRIEAEVASARLELMR